MSALIYVETTIPSFYFETRANGRVNGGTPPSLSNAL
jgi:hypothetical protein